MQSCLFGLIDTLDQIRQDETSMTPGPAQDIYNQHGKAICTQKAYPQNLPNTSYPTRLSNNINMLVVRSICSNISIK
jgi:hypothetical protein